MALLDDQIPPVITVAVQDVAVKGVFRFGGHPCLKTNTAAGINAVDLHTGILLTVPDGTLVEELDAFIHLVV